MNPENSPNTVEVIDYGGGNIGSLLRCLDRLQIPYEKVDGLQQPISGNRPMVLPGVGAFGAVMEALQKRNLVEPLQHHLAAGVPFLGVCVGLQVLFDSSTESPGVEGIGALPGQIVKFETDKVPQIGWNAITAQGPTAHRYPPGHVYFVNSYYAVPQDPSDTLYTAHYNGPFCAAVHRRNITAFQFHPEKSGLFGHRLVNTWWHLATDQTTQNSPALGHLTP